MAIADAITFPSGQKDLTRRTLLGGLTFSAATVTAPKHMLAPDDTCTSWSADKHFHPVLSLPFVRDSNADERKVGANPRCFWSVIPTGHYGTDCATGARYGALALDYMSANGTPQILQWAVFDMMLMGRRHSGIEVGFLSAFGRAATSAHARRTLLGGAAV